jgi:hypothetical protein
MKKVVFFGALALTTGMVISSCQKEAVNPGQPTSTGVQANSNSSNQRLNGTLATKKRSYTWVNDKLDCSKDGSGCEVSALLVSSSGETTDLSVSQVLKLMEIGKVDLNEYFVRNNKDLRDIFPELYEKDGLGQIASNKAKLVFEFPYLLVFDNQGELTQAFNYEATLSDNGVVSALRAAAGGYDKKAELNTDVNNPVVWKCISAGSNCKTSAASAFAFNGPWIVTNYQYLYIPTKDAISKAELTKDQTQVVLTTVANETFIVEL